MWQTARTAEYKFSVRRISKKRRLLLSTNGAATAGTPYISGDSTSASGLAILFAYGTKVDQMALEFKHLPLKENLSVLGTLQI